MQIKRGDLYETEVPDATHIFSYLFPITLRELALIQTRYKNIQRWVSRSHQFPNMTADEVVTVDGTRLLMRGKFYRYDRPFQSTNVE